MFGKLFKPRAHYVFDYKPRYFDERKERLEEMEKKYRKQASDSTEQFEISLSKSKLRSDWMRQKKTAADRGTTIRLALILAFLVGLAAYFFELHTLI